MSRLHGRAQRRGNAEKRCWRTPREALVWVQSAYGCVLDIDAAAMPDTAVAPRFFCPVPELGPHYGRPCTRCLRRGRRLLWWQGAPYCATCGEAGFGERWWDALRPGAWSTRAGFGADVPVTIWLNCPWGPPLPGIPGTAAWVDRALEEFARPSVSLGFLLVPTATDTRWWWAAASKSPIVHDLGRLAYRRPDGSPGPSPPQSSTLFVLGRDAEARSRRFLDDGHQTTFLRRSKLP